MNLTIGKLAAAGGVGVETIRYYQRRGLLDVPVRSGGEGGSVRRYDAEDLRRLKFIRAAQAAEFTLQEIGELLDLEQSDDRVRVRELARQRIAELDDKIARMTDARAGLAQLAKLCAASDKGACPILAAFEV